MRPGPACAGRPGGGSGVTECVRDPWSPDTAERPEPVGFETLVQRGARGAVCSASGPGSLPMACGEALRLGLQLEPIRALAQEPCGMAERLQGGELTHQVVSWSSVGNGPQM